MIKLLFLVGALTLAVPAVGQRSVDLVRFEGSLQQKAEFVGSSATVYDDAGKAIFNGSRDFVLQFAGAKDATVQEWDASARRVRISPAGKAGAWLSCDQLRPMNIACSTKLSVGAGNILTIAPRGDGSGGRGPAEDIIDVGVTGALPRCPGDPRCPKL